MRFLSLFDGCHMFGLALRNVGMECVGTAEIEKHPRAVTRYHYPDTPQLGDVRNVTPETVGPVDLIVGGWPCQGNSVAGDRGGMADERSGLFSEVVRCAGALAPRWLVLENVPGLLSVNDGRDMGAIVGTLGELGYGVAWRVLDAQHFGVPQRRRRVFIVGCRGDVGRAAAVLFEPESVCGDSAPGGEAGARVATGPESSTDRHGEPWCLKAEGIGRKDDAGPDSKGYAREAFTLRASPEVHAVAHTHGTGVAPCLRGRGDFDHDGDERALIAHTLTGEGFDASEDDTGRGTPLVPALSHALTAAKPAPGGEAGARVAGGSRRGAPVGVLGSVAHTLSAQHGMEDGTGRGNEPVIAHTLTGEGFDASEDDTGRGTPWPAGVAPTLGAEFGAKQGLDDQHINSQAGGLFVADMVQMTNPDNRSNPKPGDPAPAPAESSRLIAHTLTGAAFNWRGDDTAPSTQSPCLDGDSSGSIATGVRRLMPLECERLQGLPDHWTRHGRKPDGTTYEIKDGPRYRMIGNGGAVPVVEWIGRRIMENP